LSRSGRRRWVRLPEAFVGGGVPRDVFALFMGTASLGAARDRQDPEDLDLMRRNVAQALIARRWSTTRGWIPSASFRPRQLGRVDRCGCGHRGGSRLRPRVQRGQRASTRAAAGWAGAEPEGLTVIVVVVRERTT
jgi:hypothetical protein